MKFPKEVTSQLREVCEFRMSLDNETDRGAALMVAAYLDFKLQQLLAARFVNDSKVVSEFISHAGPVGTFSSRIDAAYLIGLIGEITRRNLHLIRKIRNDFGHAHRAVTFADDAIRNRCNELAHFHAIESTNEPRKMYVKTTMAILANLNVALIQTEHLARGREIDLSPEATKMNKEAIHGIAQSLGDRPDEIIATLLDMCDKISERE